MQAPGPAAGGAGWSPASFAGMFGAWEAAGRLGLGVAFPPFSHTLAALLEMLRDGSLGRAYLATLLPLLLGILLCGLAGVGLGIAMGLARGAEWLALPLLVILQAAPMAAIIPLITYTYGIGLTAKVLAVTVLAAPVIVMNSYKGIRHTSPSLLEMCRAFLGTRAQAIRKIVLPHAAGMLFTSLRLGLAMGFIGIVLAELLITPTGVGDLITYHGSVADYPKMCAAIASVVKTSLCTPSG